MTGRRWITAAAIFAAAPAVAALWRHRFGSYPDQQPERHPEPRPERGTDYLDEVEEAGFESFPASDPPSWTLGQRD